MQQAIDQFRSNIQNIRALSSTIVAVNRMTTEVVDLSDILRAEIVLAVSALDHFVHEFVRLGMLDIYSRSRRQTDSYLRFQVALRAAHLGETNPAENGWLDECIRERHSWQSFQEPDKIADAIRLVSEIRLWDSVGRELDKTGADVKAALKLIIDRRNKIAHEADMDPTNPGVRWPINQRMTEQAVNNVEAIVEAIYKVAS